MDKIKYKYRRKSFIEKGGIYFWTAFISRSAVPGDKYDRGILLNLTIGL